MEQIPSKINAKIAEAVDMSRQAKITYNKFRKKKKGSKRHGPKSLVE